MKLHELLAKRANLVTEARAILDAADSETRDLSAEDEQRYDKLMAEVDKIGEEVERRRKMDAAEAAMQPTGQPQPVEGGERSLTPAQQDLRDFRSFLRGERSTQFEFRALQAGNDEMGGYTVDPEDFRAQLIKFVDDAVVIRQRATVHQVMTADSLGYPSLDTDVDDADWTVELGTGTEDTAMRFGKREFKPHPLAKRIKISDTLLRKSAIGPEALVRDRLGYKFAVTEEKAFLTGSGSGQPLGMFTPTSLGISTGRDVSTGSATGVTGDGLIDAFYGLKEQYQRNATWLVSREFVKRARKLKTTTDEQYVWQPGLQAGAPDLILGRPYIQSEFVPSTFTTALYVGLVGDLSHYWIADSLTLRMQRLVELYAETNQIGFIGRAEVDGMPVLEEAFIRLKTA